MRFPRLPAAGLILCVDSLDIDMEKQKVTVIGNIQPEAVTVSKTGKATSFKLSVCIHCLRDLYKNTYAAEYIKVAVVLAEAALPVSLTGRQPPPHHPPPGPFSFTLQQAKKPFWYTPTKKKSFSSSEASKEPLPVAKAS
ncbi:copper transport protein cch [Phtheirospermum japonicum]|uniref:Copper transport protein cch n=1 Tax=Phtheirospermum japonicum TaxID=374723 RepID=A0A830D0H8_9LAMI|nr:copper transport protein cch [Phtheirospermum japonicum]